MSDDTNISLSALANDDLVTPFQIEGIGLRGRIARFGPLIDSILSRHNYPEAVSILLGEAVVLASLFGSALKFEGRLTLQTKGDGPVNMIVADYDTSGTMRGYAMFDADKVAALIEQGKTSSADLLGKGYLAMTIDQGPDMDNYQGITELSAEGLSHSAHEYFQQSEQIATRIRLAVGPLYQRDEDGKGSTVWRAGAIMIQHIAKEGGLTGHRDQEEDESLGAEKDAPLDTQTQEERDWEHGVILLNTAEDHELLDPDLPADRLLYRLFHEDGVRVFQPTSVAFGCRCSQEKMLAVLRRLPVEELHEIAENGTISARCEFCNEQYDFDPDNLPN
ncbi:MAG: Hsp33 family molecular chaperone [Parvibaculaceae bacterium]|nr:Hsp33 family molecular chaperone [Parvibaculaceae bacterium]